jgi:hypothetical protein
MDRPIPKAERAMLLPLVRMSSARKEPYGKEKDRSSQQEAVQRCIGSTHRL